MKHFTLIALLLVALAYSATCESDETQLVPSESQDELEEQEFAEAALELYDSLEDEDASEVTESDLENGLPEETERRKLTLKRFLKAVRKMLKSSGMGRSEEEERGRSHFLKKLLKRIRAMLNKHSRRHGRSVEEEEERKFSFKKLLKRLRNKFMKAVRRLGRRMGRRMGRSEEEEEARGKFGSAFKKLLKTMIKRLKAYKKSQG